MFRDLYFPFLKKKPVAARRREALEIFNLIHRRARHRAGAQSGDEAWRGTKSGLDIGIAQLRGS